MNDSLPASLNCLLSYCAPSFPASSSGSASLSLLICSLLFIPATVSVVPVFYFQKHSVIQDQGARLTRLYYWCMRTPPVLILYVTSRRIIIFMQQIPIIRYNKLSRASVSTTSLLKVENLNIKWNHSTDGTAWPWPKFQAHIIIMWTLRAHTHTHTPNHLTMIPIVLPYVAHSLPIKAFRRAPLQESNPSICLWVHLQQHNMSWDWISGNTGCFVEK